MFVNDELFPTLQSVNVANYIQCLARQSKATTPKLSQKKLIPALPFSAILAAASRLNGLMGGCIGKAFGAGGVGFNQLCTRQVRFRKGLFL